MQPHAVRPHPRRLEPFFVPFASAVTCLALPLSAAEPADSPCPLRVSALPVIERPIKTLGPKVLDLNKDGAADMVGVRWESGRAGVLVSLGRGDGTFHGLPFVPLFPSFAEIAVVDVRDLDLDSNLDLLIRNIGEGLFFLPGNGDGTFKTALKLEHQPAPWWAYVLNADGNELPDLILEEREGARLVINEGDWRFQVSIWLDFQDRNVRARTADFNGDGLDDIVVACCNRQKKLFINLGDTRFAEPLNLPPAYRSVLEAVDFNLDGHIDVIANYDDRRVWQVLAGRGDGTFAPPRDIDLGIEPNGSTIGDFDGDGKTEVILGTERGLLVLSGEDWPEVRMEEIDIGLPLFGPRVADFDSDGALDALGFSRTYIGLLLSSQPRDIRKPLRLPFRPRDAAIGDFSGNGIPDAVLITPEEGGVRVFIDFLIRGWENSDFYPTGERPRAIAAADLNHDGRSDVVVSNRHEGTVSVLLNRGDGVFESRPKLAAPGEPRGVAAGRLDDDAHPDIAVARRGQNAVYIYNGNGDGTFRPGGRLAAQSPWVVTIHDFDRDGQEDVAIGTSSSSGVYVYRNLGGGVFRGRSYAASSPTAMAVDFGDFDHDGIDDMVAAFAGADNNLSFYRGLGEGRFAPPRRVPYPDVRPVNGPGDLQVGDLNGDGYDDVAVIAIGGGDYVTVFLGQEDGSFRRTAYFTGGGTTRIKIADIDGDRRDDLFIVSEDSLSISVLPVHPLCLTTRRGDANLDGSIDVTDAVQILRALFVSGRILCSTAADADDDGAITVSDAVGILEWLFRNGALETSRVTCR